MPQISFFYGIYIWMNYVDHNPPHFHAWYGDYKIIVNGNWEKAQIGAPLDKINPLK